MLNRTEKEHRQSRKQGSAETKRRFEWRRPLSQHVRAILCPLYTIVLQILHVLQEDGACLVVELSAEWQTNGLKQEASVPVIRGVGVNGDVHTRDHLWRVAWKSQCNSRIRNR